MKNFVAKKGECFSWVERIENDEAAEIEMVAKSGAGTIEGGERIIAEQKLYSRIVFCAALRIERAKTVEPDLGAGSKPTPISSAKISGGS